MARLLVVDDDPAQLKMRQALLETAGHEIQTAETVSDALRLLPASQPDILLMDLRVPELRDGLELIRAAEEHHKATRIVVLSGWPEDLEHLPEKNLVARVVCKTVRSEALLRLISELALLLCLLLFSAHLRAETFAFSVAKPAEVVAEMEMSSPGSDWAKPGREAALADIVLDGGGMQNVMLYAGAQRHTYAAFLGTVQPGAHQLRIERNSKYSARESGLEIGGVRFRQVVPDDPEWTTLAHAPILYARADTIGQFTDIPLIAYCERLTDDGRPYLQYTVIFSNEDGGTSTRALMARWGRTTDIEYIYRAWLDTRGGGVERATIQAKDHKEVEFRGRREGSHPVLIPSTRNNMVSDRGVSPVRYQLPPVLVDLARHSREEIMDERPFAYRVMSQELAREQKLRPFGTVDGEKISDPRNYLYIEAKVTNRDSALAALVRLRGETVWRSSSLGRADYAISRDGWFRTTVELPPGTTAQQIGEIGYECIVKPAQPELHAGVCRLEAVSKIFLLMMPDYRPGPSLWSLSEPRDIPSGQMIGWPLTNTNKH